MDAIKQYLDAGQLQRAIDQAQQALRLAPAANGLRACFVELLCLAGQLDRADEVLASFAKHHPDWAVGAVNLRQLVRAQCARLALQRGQLADGLVATPGVSLEALLALNLHLFRGQRDQAKAASDALEQARSKCIFRVGDIQGEIRDCDDSLNGYLEGLGTDGRYYLWQWSEIQTIHFHIPSSPIELVWRRAELELVDGGHGEAFLPLTYAASATDLQQLGRATDWVDHGLGLATGVGLKMHLVGDSVVALDGRRQLERQQTEVACDAI